MKQLIGFIVMFVLVVASVSQAEVPKIISYQGVLKDVDGSYVNDGDYDITFRLYTVSEGGMAVWEETQTLPVADGVFNAYLGKATTLDLPFDVPYWLGVSIGADPELSPRIELAASPYTFRAAIADSALGAGGLYLPYSGAASADSESVFTITTLSPGGVAVRAMCGDPHETHADLGSFQAGVVGAHDILGTWGALGTPNEGVAGGSDDGTGVHGQTVSGQGVVGEHSDSGNYGVLGTANAGVEGFGGSPEDWNLGQLGLASEGVAGWSTDGTGVYGRTVTGQAVFGGHADTENCGVLGTANAGVEGWSPSALGAGAIGSSDYGTGVQGNTMSGEAVRGEHSDSGNRGVLGTANAGVEGYGESGLGVGVYGESGAGHAGHFVGSVCVNGDVGIGTSAPARSLHVSDVLRLEPRSDFPSDPANGDLCVKETVGTYHIYCYLNELWMQLD